MTNTSEDPPYIPETKDFLQLRMYVTPELLNKGGQVGHLNMAFTTLAHTLYEMYKETSISKLVDSSTLIGENTKFSEAMTAVLQKSKWSKGTIYTVTASLRKILKETAASDNFIDTIKVVQPHKELHPILGKTYTKLDKDDPVRALLDHWILMLKTNTRNRSDLSLRNIFTFYLNTVLPELGLSLNTWSDDVGKLVVARINSPDTVRKLCGTTGNTRRKFKWLRLFCTYIAPCDVDLKEEWVAVSAVGLSGPEAMFADGSDHHRISVGDLERIHAEVTGTPLHALMYMLLITTGMRVGGLARIKLQHVSIMMTNEVEIKETGRTLEKGNKWVTFMMSDQVRELMYDWIVNHRPADPSPFLFPGKCASRGHMTTSTIRNIFQGWCKAAGLRGQEFHPHALRHSFAHILLESGSTAEVVAKLLNHSSTKVTEQYYLKENAAEVTERLDIPWLTKENKKKRQIVPTFLVQRAGKTRTDDAQQKKKRRKAMAGLDMFTSPV